MFKTGDTVVHAAEGICRIEGVAKKTFDGKTDEYYVLKAVGDERSTVYIPVETVRLNPKIRLVLTKEQIREIIALIPEQEPIKCENDNARRKRFREILSGGSCAEIAQLIGTIHGMKKQIRQSGKKPKVTDERIIRETEGSVCGEFAYALGIAPDQVLFYIEKELSEAV